MFNYLNNKINTYFNNFPYDVNEQNAIINNLIKEKNDIINKEKSIYNNNIEEIKKNSENLKEQALVEFNRKNKTRKELYLKDKSSLSNINIQENKLKEEIKK